MEQFISKIVELETIGHFDDAVEVIIIVKEFGAVLVAIIRVCEELILDVGEPVKDNLRAGLKSFVKLVNDRV